MRIAVLGAAGAMARVVGRDLLEHAEGVRITAADRRPLTSVDPRVTTAQIDVRDVAATARLLRGHDAVLNCVTYYHNVEVMRAALVAKVPYSDLGGLYHVSLRQLALDGELRAAGVTALIGMGSTPGITNAMAGALAPRFELVEEIHIRVASVDVVGATPLPVPYALDTLLDELSLEPMILTAGQVRAVAPLSGRETIEFPQPVGRAEAVTTLHSEVAMLPTSFPRLRECSFKIAFAPDLLAKLRFLVELGFASREGVVRGVSARELLLALAARTPSEPLPPADCDVLRVEVVGRRGGRRGVERGELVVKPPSTGDIPAGAYDTGVPLAIAGVMLATRQISTPGVWGPERALPFETFFAELAKRGMEVSLG